MRDGLHPSLVYASLSGLFRISLKRPTTTHLPQRVFGLFLKVLDQKKKILRHFLQVLARKHGF